MIRASGRVALILVTGCFLGIGNAAQAAPTSTAGARLDSASKPAEAVKYSKHRRHDAHRRTTGSTQASSDDQSDKKTAATTGKDTAASSAIPPSVANANAQIAAADTPTAAAASAMTSRANENVQAATDNAASTAPADGQVVASDQLNDVDRALQQNAPPPQTAVVAATEAQPRPAPVLASSRTEGAWEQSSLIGKIFIGFGALLTLASAARMFMA